MTRENQKSKEARLRRAAAKKGLFIRKGYNVIGVEGGTIREAGYMVGISEGGFIIDLATSRGFQFDIDEAEEFVAEY